MGYLIICINNNDNNHNALLNVHCGIDFMQIQYKFSIFSSEACKHAGGWSHQQSESPLMVSYKGGSRQCALLCSLEER